MKDKLKKTPSKFELTAAEVGFAQAEGEQPKFSIRAYNGGPLRMPQWQHPIIVDLAGMLATKARPALLDHDVRRRVGHTTQIVNAGTHLDIEGVVSAAGDVAEEVLATAKNGFPWQASIGVQLTQPPEFVGASKSVSVNGRTLTGPLYVARKTLFREISFTALGVDDDTTARIAAHDQEITMDSKFVAWLEAGGFSAADLSEQQVATLEKQWQKELEAAATPPKPKHNIEIGVDTTEVAATLQKIADVRTICAKYENPAIEVDGKKVDLAAHAVANDWSAEKVELHALRASLSQPVPAAHINQGHDMSTNTRAIEAALLLAHTGNDEEFVAKHYDAKTIEAAQSRTVRAAASRPISYLLHEAIRAAGKYVPAGLSGDALAAEYRDLRASVGSSTVSIPGILSNVANKAALQSFLAVPTTWAQIAATRSVNDFKTYTSYRLTAAGQFEKVGKDGEIKSAEVTEASWTNKVETYGRRFTFTRQDLRNDDLSMLDGIRQLLGRMAALKLEEAVYTAWMATGDSFWATGNKNLVTSTPLTIEGLAAIEKKFLDQVDDDGKPIVIGPSRILVPTALKYTADQIYSGTGLVATGVGATAKTIANANAMAGRFAPIATPYLGNSSIVGYSDTSWYMLADPGSLAALQVAFLDGVQTPTIESQEAPFEVLGFMLRGYFDFGVARWDERGAIKVEATG